MRRLLRFAFWFLSLCALSACFPKSSSTTPGQLAPVLGPTQTTPGPQMSGTGDGIQGGDPWNEAARRHLNALVAGSSRLMELGYTTNLGSAGTCDSQHPLCNELMLSPTGETNAAVDFILNHHLKIKNLTKRVPPIEFILSANRPVILGPDGLPRTVAAWTQNFSGAPIYFYEPSFLAADTWTRVALSLHELGHQIETSPGNFPQDNEPSPGFGADDGTRSLLDRMGAMWARWALDNQANLAVGNEAFMQTLYDRVLRRPPTNDELRDGLVSLIGSLHPGQMAATVMGSQAAREQSAREQYAAILQGSPSVSDVASAAALLSAGNYSSVDMAFAESDAFFNRAGITGACVDYSASPELVASVSALGSTYQAQVGVFVCNLYYVFLHRTPRTSEMEYWIGQYYQNISANPRHAVVWTFTRGRERLRVLVKDWYRQFLSREPDAGGWDYWVGRIEGGASEVYVRASIAGSVEAWHSGL